VNRTNTVYLDKPGRFIDDPKNKKALEEVKSVTGLTVEPIAAPEPSIRAAISLYYGD